jgi:hypothetical protein
MGEAKRRRLLDAKEGKSKTPYSREKITCEILNQQTSQEITSVFDLMIDKTSFKFASITEAKRYSRCNQHN